MGNKRKEIRQALKTLIDADSQFDSVEIYSSRRSLVSQLEELPSLTIFTPTEGASPEAIKHRRDIRKLELRLEVRMDASQNVDDDLDTLLAKFEDFMMLNQNITGTILGCNLVSTETDVGIDGNKEIGLGVLIYEATYIA